MKWNFFENEHGSCAYAESTYKKFDIEVFVRRMDDEYNETYPNTATGFKYCWYLETSESFYGDAVGTILTDGYTMTLAEGMEECEKAFNNIEEHRKEWVRY